MARFKKKKNYKKKKRKIIKIIINDDNQIYTKKIKGYFNKKNFLNKTF